MELSELMERRRNTDNSLSQLPEESPAVLEKRIAAITPEEREKIDKIKNEIDIVDANSIVQFGSAAQNDIATFSDQVLQTVRAKDSGEIGAILTNLSNEIEDYNGSNKNFLKTLPVVGKFFSKANDYASSYQTLSTHLEKVRGDLELAQVDMMKDVALFDGLYEKNLEFFKNLETYIQAGEEKIKEIREVILPDLQRQAAENGEAMAAEVVRDYEASLERFEKRVHDLKISKAIAIQTAPQIRLIQNNDRSLVERVQSAIYNTIPLWRNQMVIALGLSHQDHVLKTTSAVSEATNRLLLENAKMLKQTTTETAKANERSIVDVETVKKVNEDLIETIQETLRIQQDGRSKRMAAEKELAATEEKLKQALLANGADSARRPINVTPDLEKLVVEKSN